MCLLSVCFLPPEMINVLAKVSEHSVLFNYLNFHVIAIATEREGRDKCQFEVCISQAHNTFKCMYSYPILALVDVYIIDIVSGHFVSHTGIYHWQHKFLVYMILSWN